MAGFVHRVTGSDNWRFMLSGAGVTLGLLPLGQGQWRAAFGAAVVGLLVVGAWAWGTRSSRSVGMAVGASLVGLMVVVFAVSQWPTGLITAPPSDWLGGWLSIGAGCLAALVVDWVVHRSRLRRVAPSPALASMWRWRVAVSVLATVWLVCGCGVAAVVGDGDGALRFSASDDEVLPLPTALRLVSVDHCASGGSSGNCTAEFVVAATDAAGRWTVVVRLVDHLRRRGWPLQLDHGIYDGDREIGGILPWTAHHLWLFVDEEPPDPLRAPIDATVVVYIDNA